MWGSPLETARNKVYMFAMSKRNSARVQMAVTRRPVLVPQRTNGLTVSLLLSDDVLALPVQEV